MPRPHRSSGKSPRLSVRLCGPEKIQEKWHDGWVTLLYVHPLTEDFVYLGDVPWGEYGRLSCCDRRALAMSFLRRLEGSDQDPNVIATAVLADLLPLYPAVHEYMTATRFPNGGRERKVSTLMLVADPDGLKGCLNDRQEGFSLWVTSSTVKGIFEALEAALVSSRPNWRKTNWQANDQKKKPK